MKQILLGVLFLIICGCGEETQPAPTNPEAYVGDWGYDSAKVVIRATLALSLTTSEQSSSIHFVHYGGEFGTISNLQMKFSLLYSDMWQDGKQDTSEASPVLIPVDLDHVDYQKKYGFNHMSSVTYRMTRR